MFNLAHALVLSIPLQCSNKILCGCTIKDLATTFFSILNSLWKSLSETMGPVGSTKAENDPKFWSPPKFLSSKLGWSAKLESTADFCCNDQDQETLQPCCPKNKILWSFLFSQLRYYCHVQAIYFWQKTIWYQCVLKSIVATKISAFKAVAYNAQLFSHPKTV